MASVYFDLLSAVRDVVQSATGLPPDRVRIRKRPALSKRQDAARLPMVIISPETERITEFTMPNTAHVEYPVTVTLIEENDLILEDVEWMLESRQKLRRSLLVTTFSGVSDTFDLVSYDPAPVFPPGAFDQSFDVSAQKFTYKVVEVRTE